MAPVTVVTVGAVSVREMVSVWSEVAELAALETELERLLAEELPEDTEAETELEMLLDEAMLEATVVNAVLA